jgi:oligopeptide/dipeptide ABC transporter ATP-binding protein
MNTEYILKVENLRKVYPLYDKWGRKTKKEIRAVNGVSFCIENGTIFGLIGESGSGKSTVAKCILRLVEPSDGKIYFEEKEITSLNKKELRSIRKDIQIIFQDPYSSLNPRFKIKDIVSEGLRIHKLLTDKLAKKRVDEVLDLVALGSEVRDKYPSEFSGGERQRIAIARAIAVFPKMIIADEPVSALDPPIRTQIMQLLLSLQKELKLSMLLISHELNIVYYLSQKAAVMYKGKIVEVAETDELFKNPCHPYTMMLLSSVLSIKQRKGDDFLIPFSEHPGDFIPIEGCCYQGLCNKKNENCKGEIEYKEVSPNHFVLCNNL